MTPFFFQMYDEPIISKIKYLEESFTDEEREKLYKKANELLALIDDDEIII